MYLKFNKIKVLSNLRLKFDISNDVCRYKILLQWNGQSVINMKQKNVFTCFLFENSSLIFQLFKIFRKKICDMYS